MPNTPLDQAPAARPLRILLVDDDVDSTTLMSHVLRSRGHSVRSAACVQDALSVAAEGPLDLLISDITLPDGTGLDLMRQLHSTVTGIAVSGLTSEAAVAASLSAGFCKHLPKPLELEHLFREVDAQVAIQAEIAERTGVE